MDEKVRKLIELIASGFRDSIDYCHSANTENSPRHLAVIRDDITMTALAFSSVYPEFDAESFYQNCGYDVQVG